MRVLQYRVLKDILDKIQVQDYIFAFEKEKSIPVMAQYHVGARCVISIDIQDFFTSIKQDDINHLMLGLGLGDKPSRTLSELCTYGSYVPQGAITSPKISNLISSATFGPVIKSWCDSKGYTLTIYADDVTVSSKTQMDIGEALQFVKQTVQAFSFKVNSAKTKAMPMKRRQYVCGVVVNSKTNLPKEERELLRSQIHHLKMNGLDATAAKNNIEAVSFVNHLKGRIGWLKQLNPELGQKYLLRLEEALTTQGLVAPTEGEAVETPAAAPTEVSTVS